MVRLVQHFPAGVVALVLHTQLRDAQGAVVHQGKADVRGEGDPRGEERWEGAWIPLEPDHLGGFPGHVPA